MVVPYVNKDIMYSHLDKTPRGRHALLIMDGAVCDVCNGFVSEGKRVIKMCIRDWMNRTS